MGRKCSVENCTSDASKPEHTGVTFHKVPHHSDVRPKWLSLCRIPDDKTNAKMLYVCSRHFLRADFCSFKGKKYMLRQGVLPSVFPWDKSRLEAIKAEVSIKKVVEISKKKDKAKVGKKKVGGDVSTSRTKVSKQVIQSQLRVESKDIKIEADLLSSQASSSEVEDIKEALMVKDEIKEEIDAFDQHQRLQENSTSTSPINFAINSRIEVLDNNNVWHCAKINEVDYEESEVLIHFDKFSNKFDEWISMTSPRLRPLQPRSLEKYEVGERCMAIWSDSRKFPATVTKILENDNYEVLFDDSFVKTVKYNKMSKMNVAKPAQSSPLFEPVRSTKQERRDKKRKLNVAALFNKKARVDDKRKKAICSPVVQLGDAPYLSPVSQDEINIASPPIYQWHSTWENGRPVGIESTIESHDGVRKSVIVPDPRLPTGWAKHLSQKLSGYAAGKWETVIIAPDGKKCKTKAEVKAYLDLHPGGEATINMFDFTNYRGHQKRKVSKPKHKVGTPHQAPEQPVIEETPVEEPVDKQEALESEEPPVSLKIIFENDAYKCPIEGCGKNFRRENLALMHVKHYHSEYTKYLDSTPNVADLAYARTVGENLDRSPGPPKSSVKTSVDKIPVTPKAPKVIPATPTEPKAEDSPMPESKSNKDIEIIKLLTQKPPDINKDIQPLPSGLPSNMYPDIKLKDLLGKTDDVQMRDDINIKNLCSSRPLHGIKTLLPVRPSQPQSVDGTEEKSGLKRKRVSSESVDPLKGKLPHQPAPLPTPEHQKHHPQQQPIQPPPSQSQIQQHAPLQSEAPSQPNMSPSPTEPEATCSSVPSAFDLAPPPAGLESTRAPAVSQFDGVIIEGGKIIKLERMRQEEIINCTCGFMEEDGLMIQCELCLCWQHAYCNNIQKESEVPEKYTCYICLHPLRERHSAKYLHDQDWLKQGTLPVASYHCKDDELEKRFEKLKKCHNLSGGILELREYMHTLAVKLKIAEAKNHPKLYLWSKPWEKPKLPEKSDVKEEENLDVKPKLENADHQYIKNELEIHKHGPQTDSMLMMILKSGKEDMPMLNMHNSMAPIIPQPEAAIDSDDCRLNLLDHIAHAESLIEERLDDFEKQLYNLEEGMNLEPNEEYPKTRQTLQLLIRDLDTLKRFSELPMA